VLVTLVQAEVQAAVAAGTTLAAAAVVVVAYSLELAAMAGQRGAAMVAQADRLAAMLLAAAAAVEAGAVGVPLVVRMAQA